jgi:protein required for attachment to host cells
MHKVSSNGEGEMSEIRLKEGTWVLVGDGRKALLAVNAGDTMFPNLRKLDVRVDVNPATHEQGTDAPGRAYPSMSAPGRGFPSVGGMHSAMEPTDWHMIEEHHFATTMAERINKAAAERQFKEIVIVAPPKILADLRQAFSAEAKKRVVAEIAKDLTKHPLSEIEKILTGTPK